MIDNPQNTTGKRAVPTRTYFLASFAIIIAMLDGFFALPDATRIILATGVVLMTSLTSLTLVLRVQSGRAGFALWRVGPWFILWGAITFGAASLAWITPKTGTSGIITRASVVYAMYLYSIAVAVWTAGYLVKVPRLVRKFADQGFSLLVGRARYEIKPGWIVPWAMYFAGSLARIVEGILNGSIGYLGDPRISASSANGYTQILASTSDLAIFGLAVASYRYFHPRYAHGRWTLVVMLTTEITTGAFLGMKETFFTAALAVLIPYGVLRRRLPIKALACMALAFLILVLPFNAAYRSVLRGGGTSLTLSQASSTAPEIFMKTLDPQSLPQTVRDSYQATVSRLGLIDNVAIIVQKTPDDVAFRSPLEYVYAPFVGFTPRVVWPTKPILNSGYQFSHEYYGLPSFLFTSSAVTPVGDFFRHGGWLTVAVMSFALGCAYRWFDWLVRPEANIRSVFLLLIFLPIVVKSETDFVTFLAALPSMAITAAVGARIACRKVSNSAGLT